MEKHGPNWKSGKRKNNGYVFIWNPKHPNCQKCGYLKRSRFVAEEKVGRRLLKEEVVHHINGIKDDDRIENLQIFKNNGEHISATRMGHRDTPRKYKHIEKFFPLPREEGQIVIKKLKRYLVCRCVICLKLFWTKARAERPNTKTCSKKCLSSMMGDIYHGRILGSSRESF